MVALPFVVSRPSSAADETEIKSGNRRDFWSGDVLNGECRGSCAEAPYLGARAGKGRENAGFGNELPLGWAVPAAAFSLPPTGGSSDRPSARGFLMKALRFLLAGFAVVAALAVIG